ncbi:Citrate lyase subunit beta [Streptococcus parauberis]|nr:Citrate lyase subunit beta [Streptococcus parauberis]
MERLRRTMMFVPGANAAMLRDAPLYGADSIMFDLEDSVSLKEKDTSRTLVHFALKTFDYSNVETVVRVNGLDTVGALDIEAVVLAGVNVVRLPKTETAQDIIDVEAVIERVERENGIEIGRTKMMAAIESAEGVLNAREIAKASNRLIALH